MSETSGERSAVARAAQTGHGRTFGPGETLFERRNREWREAMSNVGGPCPGCHGSGECNVPRAYNGRGTCHVCAGTGKVNPPPRPVVPSGGSAS